MLIDFHNGVKLKLNKQNDNFQNSQYLADHYSIKLQSFG